MGCARSLFRAVISFLLQTGKFAMTKRGQTSIEDPHLVEGTAETIQYSFPSLMRKGLANTAVNLISTEHPEIGALLRGPLKSEPRGPSQMMH